MHTGWDDVLTYLRENLEIPEANRSSYWDYEVAKFGVGDDGTTIGLTTLGTVSRKTQFSHTVAHWILQWPLRRIGRRYAAYDDCERLARMVAHAQRRQVTQDIIRQALALALIRQHIGVEDRDRLNLVIGDGYGVMASLLLLAGPERGTIVVNLTKPLLIDMINIRQALPDLRPVLVSTRDDMTHAVANPDIRLIAVQADNAPLITEAPVALAVNVDSMMEMDPPVIDEYFRILRGNKAGETAFYCCSRIYKKLYDGTEVRFEEFPWRRDDRILHDSVSPWDQWTYNRTPPFWHYRFDRPDKKRVVWHRLAIFPHDDSLPPFRI